MICLKIIYLFSKRKIEPEPLGDRCADPNAQKGIGMQIERGQSGQSLGGNISPVIMQKHQGDSLDCNGEFDYTGLNATDTKRGRAGQFAAVDNANEYVCDSSGLKDESRFIA